VAGVDHKNLLSAYPNAASAECNGHGWVVVTEEDGYRREGHCPACRYQNFLVTVTTFLPPRFREPVSLPPKVAEWVTQGRHAQGLYLTGQVGTGKTHTAWAAVAAWCRATETEPHDGGRNEEWLGGGRFGPTVVFTRMTDLLDDLRPGEDGRRRVRDCQSARLLVLDDIGAEKASEWTQERLYSIVDHRYANCLPLIVTSNLPPAKLEDQAGERTASRLAEMCVVVPITGTDRRMPRS
jgi:DNA replication protein DnaC